MTPPEAVFIFFFAFMVCLLVEAYLIGRWLQ